MMGKARFFEPSQRFVILSSRVAKVTVTMSWFSTVRNALTPAFRKSASDVEFRTSLENSQVPLSYPAEWLLDIFSGGRTDSGIRVSELTALQVGTVYACVNIISDGVSSLPLHVYKRTVQNDRIAKVVAPDNPVYDLLRLAPNSEMTAATFLKTMMIHDLLWGNAYAEIQRDNSNQIIGLWVRNPARTRPIRLLAPLLFEGTMFPAGTLFFETTDQLMDSSSTVVADNPDKSTYTGKTRLVLAEDMLHVPGLSLDGRLGQSTIWLSRQAIGLALATEKYGAKFFGNGARPAGILEIPNKLEERAIENLRRSWAEAHGGENAWKLAVLEQGVKFQKIAATPNEGQMLETRKFVREDISALFNVPLHMTGAQEKGGGKSNVEQASIEFVLYCLHPWLNRYELEFRRKLFPKMGRTAGQYFAKFDIRKLMYPDAASRGDFYSKGRQWGFLNANDIRELEDMNPISDSKVGETFWMPCNVQDAANPQKLGAEDQARLETQAAMDLAEHTHELQMRATKQVAARKM
jgi:HK97 family phage portal protein